jgi:hypothetical protein
MRQTRKRPRVLLIVTLAGFLAACATPRPVLTPNAHYETVGAAAAEADIEACLAEAPQYLDAGERFLTLGGGTLAGGGAGVIAGATFPGDADDIGTRIGVGAIIFAIVGLGYGAFMVVDSDHRFERDMERCLGERGYAVDGWK